MINIQSWLESLDLAQYATIFAQQGIDLDVLGELTEEDLKELGIPLGHRKRLLRAASELTKQLVDVSPTDIESSSAAMPAAKAQAERRQLTVVICDLVESTTLSSGLDPEDFREMVNAYLQCCEQTIQGFGGTVAKFLGDGLMAYFGYPISQEHDPERAVRAGLEIVKSVSQLKTRPGLTLQTRVAVATGEVVIGDSLGTGMAYEQAAVGLTLHLVARLEKIAAPNTVVISEITRRLVGGLFDMVALENQDLKGFDQSQKVWRVDRERNVDDRFEAKHMEARLAPLVGRAQEIDRLLSEWGVAQTGQGRVILLQGEAGIGKSRLVQALRDELASSHYTRLGFYCSPHHQSSALYPVIAHLERAAGFVRHDTAESKLDKLEALLGKSEKDIASVAPLFAQLLSISIGDRYEILNFSPQRQKERTFQALEAQVTGLARSQPVLMTFEDLHWIDPTTQELLNRLVECIQSLPVMMVLTYRPEFQPPWINKNYVSQVVLGHLNSAHALALVSSLVDGKALPAEVLEQIITKTDGVPLFVEELTKMMVESGVLEEKEDRFTLANPLPNAAVPDTLHASLMARLDRLGRAKHAAQVGAAIGRQFSYELLDAVSTIDGNELQTSLTKLTSAELLHQKGSPPKATYTFKHALVQDAAYSTLLRNERQGLHARIGETLEERFPQMITTEPETLAHHYTEARLALKAISYWQRASQRAADNAAHAEAIKHIARGLELVAELPADETRDQLELGLQLVLGRSLASTRGWSASEAADAFRRAHELCGPMKKTTELFSAMRGLCEFYLVRGETKKSQELVEQAVDLARRSGHSVAMIEVYHIYCLPVLYSGELKRARMLLEEGLVLYDQAQYHLQRGNTFGTTQDPRVACLTFLGMTLNHLGYPDQAVKRTHEAFAWARQLRQPFSLAFANGYSTYLYDLRDEPKRQAAEAQDLIQAADEHGFELERVVGIMHLAIAQSALADPKEAARLLTDALTAFRAAGAATSSSYFLGGLARVQGRAGEVDKGLATVAEALECMEKYSEHCFGSMLYDTRGTLRLAGSPDGKHEAEADFVKAIDIARSQRAKLPELRAAISLHKLLAPQGRGAESRATLAGVYEWFTEGFDCAVLQEAQRLLAQP